ncbi:Uncharacterized conserved protein, DUF305 family [Micromonospora purpureochromogenes]|uniref:Uncharacterized conserved protein, DUF305 family n=1 Tax=Micromonospora purpureochromogenes TaxID=47872 RepID=A0A1C5AIJ7_9ACTN|nr:DUF305 domain-containing protein [Micromonospora purpureochromogenes]SCF44901.1 Uncharacterized conserved protein, DUF305 family [Micromonospora purpureochromogenes]
MSTRTIARRAALAGVALSAALALAACGGDDHSAGSGHGMSGTGVTAGPSASASATFGDADVMFAQMMIPHHQQAVRMSELADSRAEDPEVKRLAAQIKGAQAPEIATMTGWLTAWGRPVPSGSPSGGHHDHGMPGMMSDDDMAELAAASGREFDRQFLTMMIAHHQGAITMAKEEIASGANADAKAMAQQIVTAQESEIDTMRKILARL